jgi:hypothetical protein
VSGQRTVRVPNRPGNDLRIVDTTVVAASVFLRRDEIVGLSLGHVSQIGATRVSIGIRDVGELLEPPVDGRDRCGRLLYPLTRYSR